MKKFLPVLLALAFTTLAVGITLFVVRPGIRPLRTPVDGLRQRVAEVIDEIADAQEGKQ